jgi:hypothetical protein
MPLKVSFRDLFAMDQETFLAFLKIRGFSDGLVLEHG